MARPLFALAAAWLALSAWLALPQRASAWQVCIVDTSPSVVRRRPGYARWLVPRLEQAAQAARAAGEGLCVIAFDDAVRLVHGPGPARGFDARAVGPSGSGPDAGSLLAEALALARGLASDAGAGGGRLWLCTDGAWTGADPARELAALAALGFETELVAPPAAELPDARLAAIELPRGVERGAPLAARVRYELEAAPGAIPGAVEVRLDVALEGSAGRHEWSESRALAPGAGDFVLELGPAPAGIVRVAVRLALAGDPLPENDRAEGSTRVAGELACLAVAPAESRALLEGWLAPGLPGIELVHAAPDELALLLPAADLVLALDVAPSALHEQGVEDFVRRGGGLFLCGGLELLASWRPAREPAPDAWLPLEPDPEALRERDVLLLVDGSGSMQGAPFNAARAGALELVRQAHAGDRVGLAFFTRGLEPAHLLLDPADEPERGAARARAVAALFAARSPAGATDIAGTLEALVRERAAAGREALVLLLTDGRDQPASARERLALVPARLAASGARLAVFAVGEEADTELLRLLLAPGLELERVPGELGVERLFRRELERERVEQGPRVLAAEPAGELAGLLASAPSVPLHSAVWRARIAGAATASAWRTERGAPVLALRRHGLGLAAVWAARPGWSEADLATFGPWLRALGRPGRSELGLALTLEEGLLTVAGVPEGWPTLILAVPVDPGQEPLVLAPPAAGPAGQRVGGLEGRRQAPAYELTDLAGKPLARLALAVPPSQELRSSPRLLLPEPVSGPRGPGQPHPGAPAALAVGLALLLGACAAALLATRRLGTSREGTRAMASASAARWRGR